MIGGQIIASYYVKLDNNRKAFSPGTNNLDEWRMGKVIKIR